MVIVSANVYVSTNTSQATVDIGIASANDNIDGIVAVTNDAPATYPIGVTTVTYTSSDSAGGGATVGMEAVYFHHNDHLGTPQALTDINGTKVWEMNQTPFGIATVNEDVDGDGQLVINNFRFPGQYYDAETGLNYNRYRTYDPNTGYTQHDPIGLNAGMNPFAYVGGNPITRFDPLGLDTFTLHVSIGFPFTAGISGGLMIVDNPGGYILIDDIGVFGTLEKNYQGVGRARLTAGVSQTLGCRSNFDGTGVEAYVGAKGVGVAVGEDSISFDFGPQLGLGIDQTVTFSVTVGDAVEAIVNAIYGP